MIRKKQGNPPGMIEQSKDETLEFIESVLDTVRNPLVILDHDLRVIKINRSFYQFFKVEPADSMGRLIYDLGNRQWDIPKLRELLESILPQKTSFENYEVEHYFTTIGRRVMLLNARQIQRVLGKEKIILLGIEDITDRKEIESSLATKNKESLYASEERYRLLVENINDVLCMLDTQGNVTYVSPALERLTKYKVGDIIGKRFIPIVYPDDASGISDSLNRLMSGQLEPWEFRIIDKDGTIKFMRSFSRPIYKDGQILGFTTLMTNITENKRAQDALREKTLFTENLIDAIGDPIFVKDDNFRFILANNALSKMLGIEMDKIIGRTLGESLPKDQMDHFLEIDDTVLKSGQENLCEEPLTGQNGNILTIVTRKTRYIDEHGKRFVVGVIRDITDRKIVEDHLKFINTLLSTENETSLDGILIVDEQGKIISYNQTFINIWGIPPDVAESRSDQRSLESVIDKIIDQEGFIKLINFLYKHKEEKSRDEVLLKDGRILDRFSSPMFDADQHYYGRVWYFRDITERKRSEEVLQESEEKFSHVFYGSPFPLSLTKLGDGILIEVNNAWTEAYGYTRSEACGKTTAELGISTNPEERAHIYTLLQEKGNLHNIEVTGYRTKDNPAPIILADFEILEFGGEKYLLTTAQDITGRKITEEKLLKSYQSLKKTLDDAITTMAKIAEMRDPYTAGHEQRVAELATAIAREMKLEDTLIDQLRKAAIIHDIGKMYVPSDILSRPGKLSDIEFSLIETHSQAGYDIVRGMDFPCSVAQTVLQHHERLDGSGYPNQLKGDTIIQEAKILAVADVIEAMASHRPYRAALGIDKAMEEISKNRGKLYDPDVVDACRELFSSGKFEFKPL